MLSVERFLITGAMTILLAACSSSSDSESPRGSGGAGGAADSGADGHAAGGGGGTTGGTGGGGDAGTEGGAAGTGDAGNAGTGGGAAGTGAGDGGTKTLLGSFVITWYTFQDNTPVNSAFSASGRKLIPYVSVAAPFTLLKTFGGELNYGDKLYLEFLDGRAMPNGGNHTGWVQIDDFCGDNSDDSYCYQMIGGQKYPNTDLYIGDFTTSGMNSSTCEGPAGDGQQLTQAYKGDPGSAWIDSYGGNAIGTGACDDKATAKAQQGGCWTYDGQPPGGCENCDPTTCAM